MDKRNWYIVIAIVLVVAVVLSFTNLYINNDYSTKPKIELFTLIEREFCLGAWDEAITFTEYFIEKLEENDCGVENNDYCDYLWGTYDYSKKRMFDLMEECKNE